MYLIANLPVDADTSDPEWREKLLADPKVVADTIAKLGWNKLRWVLGFQ